MVEVVSSALYAGNTLQMKYAVDTGRYVMDDINDEATNEWMMPIAYINAGTN